MRNLSLCVTVSALLLASLSAQAYRLSFKDTAGTVRTTKTTFTIKGSMDGSGLSLPFTSTSTLVENETVTALNAGVASLSRQLKSGTMSVSTTSPGEDTPQTAQQNLPSYTITYDRTPLGKVSNVKIAGDLTKLLGNSSDSLTTQILSGSEGLSFPDRDLNVGDSWTGAQSLTMGGAKADITMNFTLAGAQVVNGKTYLSITCDLTMNVPAMKVSSPLGDIPMSLQVCGKTMVLFDNQAGCLYRETSDLTNTTTITLPGVDVGAATMKSTISGVTEQVAQQ